MWISQSHNIQARLLEYYCWVPHRIVSVQICAVSFSPSPFPRKRSLTSVLHKQFLRYWKWLPQQCCVCVKNLIPNFLLSSTSVAYLMLLYSNVFTQFTSTIFPDAHLLNLQFGHPTAGYANVLKQMTTEPGKYCLLFCACQTLFRISLFLTLQVIIVLFLFFLLW